ncbi:MAG TPA: MATE family efflux transporter [Flavobacteriaceae bacterium]|jgi:putative MATE family efflux protein|nr:MATE family efflux transporter [Flavobacteriaceae bacterium]MAY52924.1 MATE family efflux transporter [Flavobacteriaceae bacterium]HBR52967.1 MATE family efflux transporter [Flavobacteriaceae bacterium]HIB47370.1 MATE family efflux transporter [Flavobacteriaceae bacterium]HIN99111.1 MATE family efflux transporter [Flavobacteriaceae bacterium]|tara:strand:- start:226341 stop:227675 length:1335 start_codon:yes stop_codon:yes gene_type:complete
MTATNISFKRIQQLAIPAIIAGIAEPVLSSTDAAVVGNIAEFGTESLAAVGIVGTFLSALIWILGQTRSAISAIISQNLGAGKIEDLKSFPAQAIFFNIALSIIVLGSTYFFVEEIFTLLNAEGMVLDFSIDYYNIRVWGFPLTLFTFAVFGIFRGLQNTFWPMIIAAIGASLNIALDFILVYGVSGYIDAMGVVGAAWASLTAQIVMAILSFALLLKKTNVSLRLTLPLHPEISRLVRMSLNLFLRSVALNTALILSTREAAALGKEYIAAYTIAFNIWIFTAFFLDGYGAAGNILGGKLLGERNFTSLWKLTKKVNLYNVGVATILALLGLLFYEPLGVLFNKDPEVLRLFYGMFFMVLICLPFNAVAFTLDSIFKGLGEMGFLRNVLLGATILGFIPVLYFSKFMGWGLVGIWAALVVWVAFRAIALLVKYNNKYLPLAKR